MASVLNEPYFQDEQAAFDELERIVWPQGPVCPFCGNMGRMYKLHGVKSKPSKKNPEGIVRNGLRKCGECRRQFTVRKGTIFEDSPIPSEPMVPSVLFDVLQQKEDGQPTAPAPLAYTLTTGWFMGHRLREAMRTGDMSPMGGAGSIVEADETFILTQEGRDSRPWSLPQARRSEPRTARRGCTLFPH